MTFDHPIGDGVALRTLTPWDLNALWAVIERNAPSLRYWFPIAAQFQSRAGLGEQYLQWMTRQAAGAGWTLGIAVQGRLAGMVWHARFAPEHAGCEIGYWLDESVRGRGLVTRAVEAMVDWSVGELGMNRIEIRASTRNQPSCAVAQRLGFEHEGTMRDMWLLPDGRHDAHVYSLLAREWRGDGTTRPIFSHDLGDGLSVSLRERRLAAEVFTRVDEAREHLDRWLPWVRDMTDVEAARATAGRWLAELAEGRTVALDIRRNGRLVGGVSLDEIQRDVRPSQAMQKHSADIGYWLSSDAQGCGCASRSVAALLDLAFEVLQLHRVTIRAEPANTRSGNVARRLGFTHEATLRQVCRYDGRCVDHDVFAMLAPDWRARRTERLRP